MTETEQFTSTRKEPRLSGIFETLDLRSQHVTDDSLSHSQFLFRLLCDEVERRDSRQLYQRLRRANFESLKILD